LRQGNEYAYVCGLLHDIGIAVALIALAADASGMRGVKFDAIWPALSSVHAQFTVQMAQLWNLPENLRAILRYHHTFAALETPSQTVAATVLAEIMADGIGYGFQSEQSDCMIDRATEVLDLTAGDLESIEREASRTLKDLLH
jgi:HD-like signal output (HDOD) protein